MKLNFKQCFQKAKKSGLNVTKTELARLLFPNCSNALVPFRRLELDKSKGIKFEQIAIICKYLDCTVCELISNYQEG